MLICLIPPSPHPKILYAVSFPSILSLPDISPSPTIPAAWSSQLHIITSLLQLEPPSSVHMLDRAVGLVARVYELTMNVQQKEFTVRFVDGRVVHVPMNSDCIRMLLGVVVDVKGCSEPDSRRGSTESSPGSITGSAEDTLSVSTPTKASKPGKHKRQRSLLFSLISSLVPKSLSSSRPPPSSAPPPTPLPPLPVSSPGLVTSPPASPRQASFPSNQPDPGILRKRARAALIDVWRRHVISALAPEHLPAAGYAEWALVAMANQVRAEMESIETTPFGGGITRVGGNRHRRTQSEGRNALDFRDRDDREFEPRQPRASSPFPEMMSAEDSNNIVHLRREQTDEWGRYVHLGSDETDVFAVGYTGFDDSLFAEHLTVNDDPNNNEHLMSGLSHGRAGGHGISDFGSCLSGLDVKHPGDFALHRSCDNSDTQADMTFDASRCPLIPSDVNDDESDDSQSSLRTPVDGEDIFLVPSAQSSHRDASWTSPESSVVSRVSSSRPRSRDASTQSSRLPSSMHSSGPPASVPYVPSNTHNFDYRDATEEEFMASQFDYLERIHAAIDVVRSRAREEGWQLVSANSIGEKNDWMDAETERSLEMRAKRRAWSSGIKISAPYSASRFAPRVWDGSFSFLRSPKSPMRPPGLASPLTEILKVRGPIVPTGLSLGAPLRSSPLAMYAWSADGGQNTTLGKYGVLRPVRTMETIEVKRSPRASTFDAATKLFPVHEDENENEDLFEHDQVLTDAVGFPRTVPLTISTGEPGRSFMEDITENDNDPFCLSPSRPRSRTTSMYAIHPAPPTSMSPILPLFRPSAPPPSNDNNGKLDASALLLQPLSSLSISPPSCPSPSLISRPSFVPRARSVSLPAPKTDSSGNKTRRTSFDYRNERFEDLSQAYASPPPEGPLIVSATLSPHEEYPRYAHVRSPIPTGKKNHASILGRTGTEMVFEQAGSEFTVGIEVALGRAEEGRVVW